MQSNQTFSALMSDHDPHDVDLQVAIESVLYYVDMKELVQIWLICRKYELSRVVGEAERQLRQQAHPCYTFTPALPNLQSQVQQFLSAEGAIPQCDPNFMNILPPTDRTASHLAAMSDPLYSDGRPLVVAGRDSYSQQTLRESSQTGARLAAQCPNASQTPNSSSTKSVDTRKLRRREIFCPAIGCGRWITNLPRFITHNKVHLKSYSHGFYKCECDTRMEPLSKECSSMIYTEDDLKNHHRMHHPDCTTDLVNCRATNFVPKLSACGVCQRLFTSVERWAEHYAEHFLKGCCKREHVSTTQVILGLLEQPDTQAFWHQQRQNDLGEDWSNRVSWDETQEQVKLLVLELSYGHFDNQRARYLVNEAIRLCNTSDHSTHVHEETAASTPSNFDLSEQGFM